jgi:phosphoglycerate dehydrogenase-like enzyme
MILFVHEVNQEYVDLLRIKWNEEIIVQPDFHKREDLWGEVEIIVGFGPTLTALTGACLHQFPKLKWIHSITSGVETLPFETLEALDIIVSNSAGIHGSQISEQALGMMLSFSRGLHINLRNQLEHRWETGYPHFELSGLTLCIVGAGSIGKEVARRAKAFDMTVIGVKNSHTEEPMDYFIMLHRN